MHGKPVFVDSLINANSVPALVGPGFIIYSVFSKNPVQRLNLPYIIVSAKELRLAKDSQNEGQTKVDTICWAKIDLDGMESIIHGYVFEGLAHNLILGEPWMGLNNFLYRAEDRWLFMGNEKHQIRTYGFIAPKLDIAMVRHSEFAALLKKSESSSNEVRSESCSMLCAA